MSAGAILHDAGIVLAAGLAASAVATVLRLPALVVLVGAGVAVGPHGLDLVAVPLASAGAQLLFSIGVCLILFHGGTGIALRVVRETAVGLGLLAVPGVLITAGVVALAIGPLFHVRFAVALLVGTVLAATDPAIVIPLFDRLGVRAKVAQTVVAESALNDPVSTVLALALAGAIGSAGGGAGSALLDLGRALALGGALGLAGGLALALVLSDRRAGIWRESPAAAILVVIALEEVAATRIGGSGYLAAFLVGLVVGNMDVLGLGQEERHAALLEGFLAQLAELVVLAVFVIVGLDLPLAELRASWWQGLVAIAVFILVARPLTVLACLLPDRRGRWTRQELAFIAWSRYTGVVPAAVASILAVRATAEPALVPAARIAVALVAVAVLATLLLQATTAGPLARRLGLLEPGGEDGGQGS